MTTISVAKTLASYDAPFWVQYTIAGWGNPAGEVYDLKNGRFLALCNSHSTGYARKVFKTSKGAEKWIERRLALEFPCDSVVFTYAI